MEKRFSSSIFILDTAFKTKKYLALTNQMLGKIIELLPQPKNTYHLILVLKILWVMIFMEMLDKHIDKLDIENKEKLIWNFRKWFYKRVSNSDDFYK